MKVFQTIHQFSNMEILLDQLSFMGSKRNNGASSSSQKYFERNNELGFDEDEEDCFDIAFLKRQEHRLVDDCEIGE